MATINLAAVDLGAESGRVLLARYDGRRLSLEEVHRFANQPVRVQGHLYWNVLGLWHEIVAGLRRTRSRAGTLQSVGVDTWGVDYGLIDRQGFLLGLPFHYRDGRTAGMIERVLARIPREEIYARTGIQFMPINTIYQLAAQRELQPGLLDHADRFLLMPDLFHAWLSGERVGERTNASTTQLWSATEHRWATELLEALDIPAHLVPPVVEPGTLLGQALPELEDELGSGVQIAVPATHDTAAAVAAVPALGPDSWAYLSSGTWSLVGVELRHPLTGADALRANFTNEGGVFGTVRFLKNVMGLWLLQECRRAWEKEGEVVGYDELFALAEQTAPTPALIDPDDPEFLTPGDMPVRIQRYLHDHAQLPLDRAAMVRCILESLVLRYREVLETVADLTEQRPAAIHVVGGGARSALLNQWLADATGLPVIAGPIEATALGNVLLQLVARGELASLQDVRTLSARDAATVTFSPNHSRRASWDDAYGRFRSR